MLARDLHAMSRRKADPVVGKRQMRRTGFTRAGTLGPIAEVVTAMGGSIDRVFQRADLPLGLLNAPDALVPLREHFRLLMTASRELHDGLFSARLGQQISVENLGVFGKWVTQASCLHEAILRANASLPSMMQSATRLVLKARGPYANWSYELADPATEGRQQNELLALSYMIVVARHYLGANWTPGQVIIAGSPAQSTGQLEQVLRANVVFRDTASTIIFDRHQLATVNPHSNRLRTGLSADDLERAFGLPDPFDLVETISALIELELLGRYPSLDWVCRRTGMTNRTLQRHLRAQGVQFSELVQGSLQKRAFNLLRTTEQTITDIATLLGYNDSAHFTRAFERWTGTSPSKWRARN
jgi:AraC-like DNA-binding protein